MRLQARVELTYANKVWAPGMLFDALERDAREMINRDEAAPFNLEDPSTRTLGDAIVNLLPPLPAQPTVSLNPSSATPDAAGGTASFTVTITGPGVSGTWTAVADAGAAWLTIVSPTDPQTVSGDVQYAVEANTDPTPRSADITVNLASFTVTQAGTGVLRLKNGETFTVTEVKQ